jgi:very-short-patch-repair endonuclease
LVVEIDGWTHEATSDLCRDLLLNSQGFTTLRVTNTDVMENIEGVLQEIASLLEALPDRWHGISEVPHPNPSPKGEGL